MAVREVDARAVFAAFVVRSGGQKVTADKLGCSTQFVNMVMRGHKAVPVAWLKQLGLRRTVVAMEK